MSSSLIGMGRRDLVPKPQSDAWQVPLTDVGFEGPPSFVLRKI
jgi:hypothetical protein